MMMKYLKKKMIAMKKAQMRSRQSLRRTMVKVTEMQTMMMTQMKISKAMKMVTT